MGPLELERHAQGEMNPFTKARNRWTKFRPRMTWGDQQCPVLEQADSDMWHGRCNTPAQLSEEPKAQNPRAR